MNRKPRKSTQPKVDKDTKINGVQQVLLGGIPAGATTFSGMNKVITSTTVAGYAGAVQTIAVDASALVNVSSNLLDPLLSEAITAFASQRGYTSSVTPVKIRNYLIHSVNALSALYSLKRAQNVKNLTNGLGQNVAPIFTSKPSGGTNDITASAFSLLVGVTAHGVGSISNAVWADTYLSQLQKIRVPQGFGHLVKALFEGYYANPAGLADSYIQFYNSYEMAAATIRTPEVAFSDSITAIDTLIAADADLMSILDFIGFNAEFAVMENWERDLKGQSLVVYNDPLIHTMLINNWQSISGLTESDISQDVQDTVFLPFIGSDIVNFEDHFTLDSSFVPYTILFRTTSTDFSLGTLNLVRTTGVFNYVAAIPAGEFASMGLLDATGVGRLNGLSTSTSFYAKYNGAHLPYMATYTAGDASLNSVVVTVNASYGAFGYDAMQLTEAEQEGIVDIYCVNLLLGPDYRSNIKARIAALQGFISRG